MSDNVEHAIASLPVTVKLIDADDDVAAVRARVTVGAVVSGKVVDVVDDVVVDVVDDVVVDVVDDVVVDVVDDVVVDVVDDVVVDVVVVVSLLPELLLGAAVVVVTAGGATVVVGKVVVVVELVVVVEVVVGKVEIVVVAGAANHFTGVFSHQHTPVRGHRNTPESLSAHARISLVEVGRASRVPLKGH